MAGMTRTDWAWLAGLFEGEGCISFTGRNSVCLAIVGTDRDIIERCRELTGVGRINEVPRLPNKTQWHWKVQVRDDVLFVLDGIQAHLGERRGARAVLARERLKHCRPTGQCDHGHPMNGENLYVSPDGRQRKCRTCHRERRRVAA